MDANEVQQYEAALAQFRAEAAQRAAQRTQHNTRRLAAFGVVFVGLVLWLGRSRR